MDRRGNRRRLRRGAEGQWLHRCLHAPAGLARIGIDGRRDRARPSRTSRSPPGSGANITSRAISENGIRLDIAPWRRPAPYTAPTESKAAGLYMICTLSKQHAEAAWLQRCADVRLARTGGRSDRRERLLRQGQCAPHADAGLLPRRDHAADDHGSGASAAVSRSMSGRSGPRSWRASSRCSSPALRSR